MRASGSTRRLVLVRGLLLGTLLLPGGCAFLSVRQGIRRVGADTRVSGRLVGEDALVLPGDEISTGPEGRTVLVMGEDAFLLGVNTRLRFDLPDEDPPTPTPTPTPGSTLPDAVPEGMRTPGFTLHAGRVLSVFGHGSRIIKLPTAILGIRGTALYLEVHPEQDYVCLCYGRLEIRMRDAPEITETYETRHHSARMLKAHSPIRQAEGVNHTDEELFMLEALVNRRPPFEEGAYADH
ncbi:MAG: hypothetical protein HQL86_05030 [Magnetococcales bacterium]|nr:hypothetical protein [Magnetococcales bacterium]